MASHPIRTVRVPDAVWRAAQARAAADGTTVSEVINRALRRYAAGAAQTTSSPSSS